MRRRVGASWLCVLTWFAAAGCAQNPYVLQGHVETLQRENQALAQKYQELQSRMATLDQDNLEQGTLYAQSQQRRQVLEDQLVALRQQLSDATTQLAKVREQGQDAEQRAQTLAASVKRRIGATITANNSLREQLPTIDIPGVHSRLDGDVVRVELPADPLFDASGRQLTKPGAELVDRVAAELYRAYPDQIIGVEGHTDGDPIRNSQWANNHHLSVGRAMAVYDYLIARTRFRPEQLFVVGHGANHPVVSNGTDAGKARNRRVELVVYPERPR